MSVYYIGHRMNILKNNILQHTEQVFTVMLLAILASILLKKVGNTMFMEKFNGECSKVEINRLK